MRLPFTHPRRPSAGTVIAFIALFFAVSGSAVAARRYLITSTQQVKPSVLKRLHGPAGPQGSPGPVGPQGPAGPTNLASLTAVSGPINPIAYGGVSNSVATCPAGAHVVSGGVFAVTLNGAATSSATTDQQSWFAVAANTYNSSGASVQAVAYCATAGQAVAASAPRAAHARAVREADALTARLAQAIRAH